MATHRKAQVFVANNTGYDWLSVSLVHKYSDSYKNTETWGVLRNGESTLPTLVDYNTGLLTTGRDWWYISWIDFKGNVYMTHPHNFRGVIDFAEKVMNNSMKELIVLGVAIAVWDPEPLSKVADAALTALCAIASTMLNNEGTAGFKQHILRDEDQHSPTKINVLPKEVQLRSKSGVSRTKLTKVFTAPAPKPEPA